MAHISSARPVLDAPILVLGSLALIGGGALLLSQVPAARDICRDVLRDPRLRVACRQAAAQFGQAILESLLSRLGGAALPPAVD
ncbi:MAG: hypothetical protein LCH87_16045 [Actinobacteria bacterium]|nr:hypothetical protein [Actinomycetota bacterium]